MLWDLSGCRRIMVTGCSGSGKSTMTRLLAERLGLPPVHLDIHFWKPGWKETPAEEWREKVRVLAAEESWVIDGTFSGTMDLSIPRADAIVILEMSRWLCLYRAVKRVFLYDKVKRRPDMAEGCDETFDLEFYRYILSYQKKSMPQVRAAIARYSRGVKVISLEGPGEVEEFLMGVGCGV